MVMVNMQGRLVLETIEQKFTLSNNASGTYLIKAQTNHGVYRFKLIKQ